MSVELEEGISTNSSIEFLKLAAIKEKDETENESAEPQPKVRKLSSPKNDDQDHGTKQ